MLTNFDLADSAKDMNIPLVGIYYKDQLPRQVQQGAYIINMQDHDKGYGTHWVGLVIKGNKAEYFDSFGFGLPTDVSEFAHNHKPIIYNTQHLQNIDSTVCGSFVLAWLWYLYHRKGTTNGFVRLFSKDPEDNRRILQALLLPL